MVILYGPTTLPLWTICGFQVYPFPLLLAASTSTVGNLSVPSSFSWAVLRIPQEGIFLPQSLEAHSPHCVFSASCGSDLHTESVSGEVMGSMSITAVFHAELTQGGCGRAPLIAPFVVKLFMGCISELVVPKTSKCV